MDRKDRNNRARREMLIPIAFVIKEHRKATHSKDRNKYRMYMHGFFSESTLLYRLNYENYSYYLSDWQQMRTGTINKAASYFLNNKVAFVDMLDGVAPTPKTLALILRGELIPRQSDIQDIPSLQAYLAETPSHKLVIKPIYGAEGKGVAIIKALEGKFYKNKEEQTFQEMEAYISELDGFFVSEFIQQGEFAQSLYPNSLNTIRMLTMIDPETHRAFIAGSAQRIGTDISMPTDNFRQGGLSFEINSETGYLCRGVLAPQNEQLHWYYIHPDTGEPITNKAIPHWRMIKEKMIEVAEHIYRSKQIHYCGWDIVITDDGFILLEGNSWPGVSVIQAHQPLLVDEQVRAFYQYHNVI